MALCALLPAASQCGEYAHTNPYEAEVPVAITIIGPKVTTPPISTEVYSYTSDPVLPGASPEWISFRPEVLKVLGVQADGSVVVMVKSSGATVLSVTIGAHTQKMDVTVP